MQVTTIGLDLAKNVFQVHGITEAGDVVFNRALRRSQVLSFFENLEPCLVGIEACASSHYWAREVTKLGHDVRLIPPVYGLRPSNVASQMRSTRQLFARR